MAGLLDLISARNPQQAQKRARGLLEEWSDPAAQLAAALREAIGADQLDKALAWRTGKLDAVTGSHDTMASVENDLTQASLNNALLGGTNPVIKSLKNELATLKAARDKLVSTGFIDDAGNQWRINQSARGPEYLVDRAGYTQSIPAWNLWAAPTEARRAIYATDDALRAKQSTINETKDTLQAVKDAITDRTIQNPEWARVREPRSVAPDYVSWWKDELGVGGKSAASAFLNQAAKHDDLFLYGRRQPGADIVGHYANKSGVPLKASPHGKDLSVVNEKTGEHLDIFDFYGSKPIIRSTSLRQGSGTGKPAYQAAFDLLTDAGKKAYPDTGLTQINDYRKLSNALAGMLRSGKQPAVMNSSYVSHGNPSAAEIFIAEARETIKRAPSASKISFDGMEFRGPSGDVITDKGIVQLLGDAVKDGVGPQAAKRAAVARYVDGLTKSEAAALGNGWKSGALFPATIAAPGLLFSEEQIGAGR